MTVARHQPNVFPRANVEGPALSACAGKGTTDRHRRFRTDMMLATGLEVMEITFGPSAMKEGDRLVRSLMGDAIAGIITPKYGRLCGCRRGIAFVQGVTPGRPTPHRRSAERATTGAI